MQIKVYKHQKWNWNTIKSKFHQVIYNTKGKRKLFIILLFTSTIFTIGVIAQRNYAVSNKLFKPLILDNYDIFVRKFYSLFINPEILSIDLKYKDLQKLEFLRHNSIVSGTTEGNQEWVKVIIQNKSQTLKAKVRLKGGMADEHMAGQKWSFRVKISDDNTLFGMKEFSILY